MDPLLLRLLDSLTDAELEAASNGSENLTEDQRVQVKVKSLMASLTRWNFMKVKDQLLETIRGAQSVSLFEFLVSCAFDMAIADDAFILFGHLCAELCFELPSIPSVDCVGGQINFKRTLINKCQMEFENATDEANRFRIALDDGELRVKLVGTVRFVAELFKSNIVTVKICHNIIRVLIACPIEGYIEAVYRFMRSIGIQADCSPGARLFDVYFSKLEEFVQSPESTPRAREMISELQHLRANNWVLSKGSSSTSSIDTSGSYDARLEPDSSEGPSNLLASQDVEHIVDNALRDLQKALKAIGTLKRVVNREHLMRVEAEEKAEMLEKKLQDETRHRKEAENTLAMVMEELEEKMKEEQTPPSFVCPISQEVMKDPQVAADGFTYEAEAIRKWFERGHDTSPMTNLKLSRHHLLPNHTLRSAIQDWHKQQHST